MSTKNEPASPIIHPDGTGVQHWGLSKRELFAAMAMQGMDLGPHSYSPGDLDRKQPQVDARIAAESAVRCADALLAALERTE